jgi:hypothetical protein
MDHKLFKFFKSRLSNPPQEDWNTPSDSIFENAIKELNAQKFPSKDSKSNSMKPLLLLLVLLIGTYTAYNISQTSDISDEQTVAINSDNTSNNNTTNTNQNSNIQVDQESVSKVIDDNSIVASAVEHKETKKNLEENKEILRSTNGLNNNEVIDTKINSGIVNDQINRVANSEINRSISENTFVINNVISDKNSTDKQALINSNLVIDEVQKSNSSQIQQIEFLPINKDFISFDNSYSLDAHGLDFDPIAVEPVSNFPNKKSFGVVFNNTFTNSQMRNNRSVEFDDLDIDNQYNHGTGLKLNFKLPIHKGLSFVTGLSYNKIESNSIYEATSDIESDNFLMDALGDEYFVDDMIVYTPFGSHKMPLVKPINHQILSSKSNVTNSTVIEQDISFGSLDIGLAYDFKTSNRLSYFVSSGLGINALLKTTTSLNSTILMDGQQMWVVTDQITEGADFQNYFINIHADAGLAYRLDNRFSLTFSAGYAQTLNSKVEHIDNLNSKTFLNQINLGVGFNVSF